MGHGRTASVAARLPLAGGSVTPPGSLWMLPDGIPNLHPVIVHFPIALLATAAAADILACLLMRQPTWRNGAAALYVLGTLSLIAAYVTGREAAAAVFTPGMAHGLVDEHWTWALWTSIYFTGLTIGRLAAHRRLGGGRSMLWGVFLIAGAGGVLLLVATGERGARLVYEYGVGVLGFR